MVMQQVDLGHGDVPPGCYECSSGACVLESNKEEDSITQHLLPEDTAADKRAMRQLATVIGCFAIATAVLAIAVGIAMS